MNNFFTGYQVGYIIQITWRNVLKERGTVLTLSNKKRIERLEASEEAINVAPEQYVGT